MEDKKALLNEQLADEVEVKEADASKEEVVTAGSSTEPKPEKKTNWGTAATKKFMAIALAATVLINAAVTAGLMALMDGRHGMKHDGRPGTEMFSDKGSGGKGQMGPPDMNGPGNAQNGTGQQAAPGNPPDNNGQQAAPGNNGQQAAPGSGTDNTQNQSTDKSEQDT